MSVKQPDVDATQGHSDPFYFPGEQEEELKQAWRQHELSQFTTEELQEEIYRREEEPIHGSLTNLKAAIQGWHDSLNFTPTPDRIDLSDRPF